MTDVVKLTRTADEILLLLYETQGEKLGRADMAERLGKPEEEIQFALDELLEHEFIQRRSA